jgi:hypothetical protein
VLHKPPKFSIYVTIISIISNTSWIFEMWQINPFQNPIFGVLVAVVFKRPRKVKMVVVHQSQGVRHGAEGYKVLGGGGVISVTNDSFRVLSRIYAFRPCGALRVVAEYFPSSLGNFMEYRTQKIRVKATQGVLWHRSPSSWLKLSGRESAVPAYPFRELIILANLK